MVQIMPHKDIFRNPRLFAIGSGLNSQSQIHVCRKFNFLPPVGSPTPSCQIGSTYCLLSLSLKLASKTQHGDVQHLSTYNKRAMCCNEGDGKVLSEEEGGAPDPSVGGQGGSRWSWIFFST